MIVNAKDSTGNIVSEYIDIIVNAEKPLEITKFSYSGSLIEGNLIKLNVESNKENAEYRFQVKDSNGNYTTIKAYGNEKLAYWTPKERGKYMLIINMKDSNNKILSKYLNVLIDGKIPLAINEFNYKGLLVANNTLKLNAKSNRDNVQYRFQVKDIKGNYDTIKNFDDKNFAEWKIPSSGNYMLIANVKDMKTDQINSSYLDIKINKNLIVIDPGHNINGFIDTGSVTKINGITYREADLNMQLALKLQKALQSLGYAVVLTQEPFYYPTDTDVIQSLQRRVKVADKLNADLFVSIHHNNYELSNAYGTEVWYSNPKEVKELPNATIESKILAEKIASSLATSGGFFNRGYKNGNLYVTRMTKMPSILIEAGFISNPNDVIKISNPVNQTKVSNSMAKTIDNWFKTRN